MLNKLMTAAALAAMTCAGPAVATPAEANAGKDLVQATIQHGDLDLTSAPDLARLKQRVARKARTICASSASFSRIDPDAPACRAQVIASANIQIDRAVQVALLRQKARKG